jgi:hypothetical protein
MYLCSLLRVDSSRAGEAVDAAIRDEWELLLDRQLKLTMMTNYFP